MTAIEFLAGWAIRSSALIACGALLLWLLRVKDASIRLATWTALLVASLVIPALTFTFPKVPIMMMKSQTTTIEPLPNLALNVVPKPVGPVPAVTGRFDWPRAVLAAYSLVALLLLLRLCTGLMMSLRLLRASSATGQVTEGIPVLESVGVPGPVTLGIVRARVVLPQGWREWNPAKLNAVLAHERSHVRRYDPAVQLLSAIHRAVLWHSPLSWFLHRLIVRTAEEASDDAAVAEVNDRTFYAEVLLEFMQRGNRRVGWLGVPMARYGRAAKRINRILEEATLSRGITRWGVTAIVTLVLPLAYVAATARESQAAPQGPPAAAPAPVEASPAPIPAAPTPALAPRAPVPGVAAPANPAPARAAAPRRQSAPAYLEGLGTVNASATLVVRSKVDGELESLGFEEGKPVTAGQLLATIEPQSVRAQLDQARRDLANDRKRLANSVGQPLATVVGLENEVKADQNNIENFERSLAYGQIRAPFSGVAGLRKIDPGNFVRTGDTLVVIAQLQPIAVLFTLAEDNLPQVRTHFGDEVNLIVEAWSRNDSVKLATGRLTAIDNEIDKSNGTILLKAAFENNDGALFPNQFVNVHLILNGR